jgi:spore coat protein U-like protein
VKYTYVKSAMAAAAVLAITLVSVPNSAFASTTTTSMAVSATVVNSCNVSANPLAFGQYSGAALNVSTTISVTCNTGDTYSVGLNAGGGTGATVTNRLMTLSSGSSTLAYSLLSGSFTGTNWGNSSGSWVSGTGNGSAQTLTVYGVVAAGLYPTAGSYGDSVTVTLTY